VTTKKIKIAVLEFRYGGNVTGVNDLLIRLDPERYEIMFIYLTGNPSVEHHLEKEGHKVYYLSSRKSRSFRPGLVCKLVKLLKSNDVDLLHCHAHKSTQYGALAARFLPRLKVVAHVHGLRRTRRFVRKLTNLLALGRVDRFLTVARAVADDLVNTNWRIPDSKVTVLENSVDYDRFARETVTPAQMRGELSLPQDAFVFGTVGRLDPTKGIPYLIEAFARVRAEFTNARLLLVGKGPFEAQFRQQVKDLALEDSVCFAGFRLDVVRVYRAMDVFVIASVAEGMPRVLLEAMAAGIPCIGTRVGGIPEVIAPEVGQLVPAADNDALAQAMIKVIQNAAHLEQSKAGAQTTARCRYSHDVVYRKLEAIYRDVLGCVEKAEEWPKSA